MRPALGAIYFLNEIAAHLRAVKFSHAQLARVARIDDSDVDILRAYHAGFNDGLQAVAISFDIPLAEDEQ